MRNHSQGKNRRNPLPHKSKDILESSKLFEKKYDITRAELAADVSAGPKDIGVKAKQALQKKVKVAEKQKQVSSLAEIIDFEPYFESLANFGYDLQGFIQAVEYQMAEEKNPEAHEQLKSMRDKYSLIFSRIRAVIKSVKSLQD